MRLKRTGTTDELTPGTLAPIRATITEGCACDVRQTTVSHLHIPYAETPRPRQLRRSPGFGRNPSNARPGEVCLGIRDLTHLLHEAERSMAKLEFALPVSKVTFGSSVRI